jgi:hypothetical protein
VVGLPATNFVATFDGRFTRPPEVADLDLLPASDHNANVTGADFAIDGGLISTR